MASGRQREHRPAGVAAAPPRQWLLFVHQLPSSPSNIRVRTWRRLQQLGAIVVKQAVYVLPDSPGAREDFEWLKAEIEEAGGQATVFSADVVDTWSNDELVEEFRRLRQLDYTRLAREIERETRRAGRSRTGHADRRAELRRSLEGFRQRLAVVERVDFFGSPGHDRATALLQALTDLLSEREPSRTATPATKTRPLHTNARYRRRHWVTRPRPGVDRMASAWLIRRFIDPQASFGFVADREAASDDSIPFDMFGVEFTHRGEHCTFETLCEAFAIRGAPLVRIAAIVHDLDLKDRRFGAPEAPTIGAVIEGLQLAHDEDDALLAHGMTLFEALHRVFERSARAPRPRRPARQHRRPRRSSR